MSTPPERMLNLTEAGVRTGLGRDSIRRLIDGGQLDCVPAGERRFVTEEALRRAGLLQTPVAQPPPHSREIDTLAEPAVADHEIEGAELEGDDDELGAGDELEAAELDDDELEAAELDDDERADGGRNGTGFLAGLREGWWS